MKTAVSVPDELYARAEEATHRLGLNRSQLYTQALAEYLRALEGDPVTDRLDELAGDVARDGAPVLSAAATRRLIDAGGWTW